MYWSFGKDNNFVIRNSMDRLDKNKLLYEAQKFDDRIIFRSNLYRLRGVRGNFVIGSSVIAFRIDRTVFSLWPCDRLAIFITLLNVDKCEDVISLDVLFLVIVCSLDVDVFFKLLVFLERAIRLDQFFI